MWHLENSSSWVRGATLPDMLCSPGQGVCFGPQRALVLCGTFKGGRGSAMVFGAGTLPIVATLALCAEPFASGAFLCRGAPIALTPCDTSAG